MKRDFPSSNKKFYRQSMPKIILHGKRLNSFSLTSGAMLVCLLSLLIFNITLEILASASEAGGKGSGHSL